MGRVAAQDVTVLIEGESGTGKEMVARAIFQHSRRNEGPFLAINCAAIPETLLESELFGHERGAFTGADRQRIGKFEQVDRGTLFLDELGDMPLATQSKLLRLLQEGTFQRVGSNETLRSDVRIIAATNQNLDEMVQQGSFRRDLYYRLNTISIKLPALRERADDVPLLANYFARAYARDLGKTVRFFSDEAFRELTRYPWPGNVRELQSVIKFALLHAVGESITPEVFPESFRSGVSISGPATNEAQGTPSTLNKYIQQLVDQCDSDVYRRVHLEVDRVLLEEVLNRLDGNQAHAAALLGISRTTLRARIAELGLSSQRRFRGE